MRSAPDIPIHAGPFLIAVIGLYLFLSLLSFDQVEEDAFIYFRIAENVSEGHGYVFNSGGERVEAGSSLLWLLVISLLNRLPLDIVVSTKLVGYVFGVGSLLLTFHLASLHVANRYLRLLPPLLLAVSTPFLMQNQRGLETPLYALLVLALGVACSDDRWFRFWVVPAALLLPARPEGFFVLVALLPAFWIRRSQKRLILRSTALLMVAALLLLALRFLYFQDLVPQPFYIKMRPAGALGWLRIHGLLYHHFVYFFAVPLLFTLRDRSFWSGRRVILVGFLGITVLWSGIAQDYMPYHRHLVPSLPFLYVLIASGLDYVAGARARGSQVLALACGAAFVLSTLLLARSVWYFGGGYSNPIRPALASFLSHPLRYTRAVGDKMARPLRMNDLHDVSRSPIGTNYQSLVGQFIKLNYPKGSTFVYDQMGQTPYYAGSDKVFVDSWGLTDRTIGYYYFRQLRDPSLLFRAYDWVRSWLLQLVFSKPSKALSTEQALDYLFAADPDAILINRVAASLPRLPARLREDPRLRAGYEPAYLLADLVEVYDRKPRYRGEPVAPPGLAVSDLGSVKPGPESRSGQDLPRGRYRTRPRLPEETIGRESYEQLIGLGYLQGYRPAPAASGVLVYEREKAFPGLNLMVSGHAPEAVILDMEGNVLHRWRYARASEVWRGVPPSEGGAYWRRAHVFANGDLLAIYEQIGLIKLDEDSRLLWAHGGPRAAHHDLDVRDDGTIYLLTSERKSLPQLSSTPVLDEYITILDPDGKVIAEHSIVDLISHSPYASLLDRDLVRRGGYFGHVLHTNTIEVMSGRLSGESPVFAEGNVLLSVLMLDTVLVADLDRGQVVAVLTPGMWTRQHQPTLLENGNMLVFDNKYREECSRVVEVAPLTGEVQWAYTGCQDGPFFSATCGSNQRLPNGNTLITETDSGRAFEVDPSKEIVWEYINPHRAGAKSELIASLLEIVRLSSEDYPFVEARARELRDPHE